MADTSSYMCAGCGPLFQGDICPLCGVRRPVAAIGRARDRCYTDEKSAPAPPEAAKVYEDATKKPSPKSQPRSGGIRVGALPEIQSGPLLDRSEPKKADAPSEGGDGAQEDTEPPLMPRRSGIPKPPTAAHKTQKPAAESVREEQRDAESSPAVTAQEDKTPTEDVVTSAPQNDALAQEQSVEPQSENLPQVQTVDMVENDGEPLLSPEEDEVGDYGTDGVFRAFGRSMKLLLTGQSRKAVHYIIRGGGERSFWLHFLLTLPLLPVALGAALFFAGIIDGSLIGSLPQSGASDTARLVRAVYGCFVLSGDRLLTLAPTVLIISAISRLRLGLQRTLSLICTATLPLTLICIACAVLGWFLPDAAAILVPGAVMVGVLLSGLMIYMGLEFAAIAQHKSILGRFAAVMFIYITIQYHIIRILLF